MRFKTCLQEIQVNLTYVEVETANVASNAVIPPIHLYVSCHYVTISFAQAIPHIILATEEFSGWINIRINF